MKSIIVSDLISLYCKNKKYIILYYVILLVSIGMVYILDYGIDNRSYFSLSGLLLEDLSNPFQMLFFLFNLIFIIYISLYLFCKDLILGKENIFLRLKITQWIIYKIFSTFICILLYRLFMHIIILILFKININFKILYVDLLYFSFIELFSFFIYIVGKKYKIIIIPFLILICCIVLNIKISPMLISKYCFIIISLIIFLIVMCYKINKYINISLFEDS